MSPAHKKTPEERTAVRRERNRRYREHAAERLDAGEPLPPSVEAQVLTDPNRNRPGQSEPEALRRYHGRGSSDGKLLAVISLPTHVDRSPPCVEWSREEGALLPSLTEARWLDQRDRARRAPNTIRVCETPQGRYTYDLQGSAEEVTAEVGRVVRLVLDDLPHADEHSVRRALANCPPNKIAVLA